MAKFLCCALCGDLLPAELVSPWGREVCSPCRDAMDASFEVEEFDLGEIPERNEGEFALPELLRLMAEDTTDIATTLVEALSECE